MNSICQHCGKTFADKHKLAVHSLNHAKDEIKCHICEKMYEEFRLPMSLKIHVIYDHYEFFFEIVETL